jgi:hypothetical protein
MTKILYAVLKYKTKKYGRCSGKQVKFLYGSATVMRKALSRGTDSAGEVCTHENGQYDDGRIFLREMCLFFIK